MKKHARRIVCLLLAFCLMNVSVFALNEDFEAGGEDPIQPRFTYIWSVTVGLGIELDGEAICDTGVTLHESTHDARIDMTLRRNDGSGWDDVKSWTVTDDGPDIDIEESWYVVSGYDYQVVSTIYVYNVNGRMIEVTTGYSPVVEF